MSWLPTQQKLISASDWPNNVGSQAILAETPSGCQSTSDLTLASLLQAWISDTGPFQAYQSTFLPTDNALFGNTSFFSDLYRSGINSGCFFLQESSIRPAFPKCWQTPASVPRWPWPRVTNADALELAFSLWSSSKSAYRAFLWSRNSDTSL